MSALSIHDVTLFVKQQISFRTHPPGASLLIYGTTLILGKTPLSYFAVTLLFSALSTIPLYFLANELYGVEVGVLAATLLPFTPLIILWMPIMELAALFFTTAAAASFLRSFRGSHVQSFSFAILSGVLCFLASFVSLVALSLGLFFVMLTLLDNWIGKQRRAVSLCGFFTGLLITYLVSLSFGWDLLASLAIAHKTNVAFYLETNRPWISIFRWDYNMVPFLMYVGIPASLLFLWRALESLRQRSLDPYVVALIFTMLAVNFSGVVRGYEFPRSFIFWVPLMLPAVGQEIIEEKESARFYWTTVLLQLAQCIVYTYFYPFFYNP
jgi:4-amino-4-deoxy-L-arabinose transferase-like glycosyltransferase